MCWRQQTDDWQILTYMLPNHKITNLRSMKNKMHNNTAPAFAHEHIDMHWYIFNERTQTKVKSKGYQKNTSHLPW
jgi:hypothetical protein